jgi:hypothetical protein
MILSMQLHLVLTRGKQALEVINFHAESRDQASSGRVPAP